MVIVVVLLIHSSRSLLHFLLKKNLTRYIFLYIILLYAHERTEHIEKKKDTEYEKNVAVIL